MRFSDAAELLLLAAVWGGSFLFMRIAAPVLGPVWLIEIRVLLAGLLLLPLVMRLGLLRELRKHWVALLMVGCFNSALPFVLLAFASIALPVGFTAILNGTVPLFGMVVGALWLKERLTGDRMAGFVIGFIGVVVLVGWQVTTATPAFWLAVSAGLLAALMYAISAPYIKQTLAGVPPIAVTVGSQLSAALLLLPAMPLTIPTQALAEGVSTDVILSILGLVVLSTAFAYILYFRLIQNIGSTRALTVAYLIPMFAILWGALALGEAVTVSILLGCGLVLVGTATANGLFRRMDGLKK
ncbi:MAG: DMT family transporter [Phormidesmis sp.]